MLGKKEMALIILAYGAMNTNECKIEFQKDGFPKSVLKLFDNMDECNITSDVDKIIVQYSPRYMDYLNGVNEEITSNDQNLYRFRWFYTCEVTHILSETEYYSFMEKLTMGKEENLDYMIFSLIFLSEWAHSRYYEENDATTFECSYNELPVSISDHDLERISYGSFTVLPSSPRSYSGVVYITVPAINIENGLIHWCRYGLERVCQLKRSFFNKMTSSDNMAMLLENATHAFCVKNNIAKDFSTNDADFLLAKYLQFQECCCTNYKLVKGSHACRKWVMLTPSQVDPLHYEICLLTNKSNNFYIDIYGDICTSLSDCIFGMTKISELEERFRAFPINLHVIQANISVIKLRMKILNCPLLGETDSKLNADNGIEFLRSFASYYIKHSRDLMDIDLSLLLDTKQISKSLSNINFDYLKLDYITDFVKMQAPYLNESIPDIIWNFALNGMHDILTEYIADKTHLKNSMIRIIQIQSLILDKRKIPKMWAVNPFKNRLFEIASCTQPMIDNNERATILVCAALNKNAYRVNAHTQYISKHLTEDMCRLGINNLKKIKHKNMHELYHLLKGLGVCSDIPIQIRKLAKKTFINFITEKMDGIYSNRRFYSEILTSLNNRYLTTSTTHLEEEYSSNYIMDLDVIDMLFHFILEAGLYNDNYEFDEVYDQLDYLHHKCYNNPNCQINLFLAPIMVAILKDI